MVAAGLSGLTLGINLDAGLLNIPGDEVHLHLNFPLSQVLSHLISLERLRLIDEVPLILPPSAETGAQGG